jgi:hypothetical protein
VKVKRTVAEPGISSSPRTAVRVSCGRSVVEPVPVPTFLSRYDSSFKKKFGNNLATFYILSCFTRKKLKSFIKFIVKCEWKIGRR